MRLEVYQKGLYKIIKIEDQLNVIGDLTELKSLIEGYLDKGVKYVAVNFSDTTYLYSGAISVLINCYKMIKESNGDLCILEPNKDIIELLRQMNIDSIIDLYQSEDALPDSIDGF
jgi:anti-anti-sigma factor